MDKYNNEDVDLKQVLHYLKKFFIVLAKGVINVVLFYKRKWVLFLFIIIIGGVLGYGLDIYLGNKKNYVQKITIEPKYGFSGYIYDFINGLEDDKAKITFKETLKLEKDDFKYFKNLEIEPVIVTTDLIEYFSSEFGQNDFYKVLDEYSLEDLTSKKFRDIYKHHVITFTFSDKEKNRNLVEKVLLYLKKNDYYSSERKVKLEQANSNIKKNRESLQFIDQYLQQQQEENLSNTQNTVIVSENLNTVTVATLLNKKEDLIRQIDELEKIIELDQELFSIIDYGIRIYSPLSIKERFVLILPVFLFLLVSIIFLFKNLKGKIQEFVNE